MRGFTICLRHLRWGGVFAALLLSACPSAIQAEKPTRTSGFGEIIIIRRKDAPKAFEALAREAIEADAQAAQDPENHDKAAKPDQVIYRPGTEPTEQLIREYYGRTDPTIHIHPKYYNRPIEYQGPFMEGGRTVIVAADPKTLRRRQTERIQLPPGAPTIVYDDKSITYIFDNHRFIFRFDGADCCKIRVIQRSGVGTERRVVRLADRIKAKVKEKASQTPLTESVRTNILTVKDTARGAFGAAGTAASTALDKAGQLFETLPVVQMLKSAAAEGPQRGQTEALRQQGLKDARNARQFVPTNR